jgi:hypothetical protein
MFSWMFYPIKYEKILSPVINLKIQTKWKSIWNN